MNSDVRGSISMVYEYFRHLKKKDTTRLLNLFPDDDTIHEPFSNIDAGLKGRSAIKPFLEVAMMAYDELEESHNQLELANEEVKLHSKMQNEFINVAAHELRTRLQPILGLSDSLRHKTTDPEQHELANVIYRNAKR